MHSSLGLLSNSLQHTGCFTSSASSPSRIALAKIREAYRCATGSSTEHDESSYRICGYDVMIGAVGRTLTNVVTSSLRHLQTQSNGRSADLTVELWDESAAGVSAPELRAPEDSSVWNVGDITYWHSYDRRFYGQRHDDWVTFIDTQDGILTGWTKRAEELPWFEMSKPLRLPLTIWHHARGIPTIHAGLVARRGHGVLLAGSSGVGKSTTALACLRGGLDYLGDDLIGLQEIEAGSFRGHSLYSSIQMWPENAARFPELVPASLAELLPCGEKLVIQLSERFANRLAKHAAVRAVGLPRIAGGRDTRIRPATPGQALLALAPSSIVFNFSTSPLESISSFSDLVERVPCFWIELGEDLTQIPQRIHDILDRI